MLIVVYAEHSLCQVLLMMSIGYFKFLFMQSNACVECCLC
jgi:hypothetical protein